MEVYIARIIGTNLSTVSDSLRDAYQRLYKFKKPSQRISVKFVRKEDNEKAD